ncbi:ribosomal protein L7/L12 [Sinanaerobacter sp. ZZT-01]|uniref:ribosomal protein L7/L12 n=1 Tax=Sinanaerobacter sp. ZZT-01 TaxID=3111540 RepID=UPI002D78AC54|nr:ribosomal protein L7/L12 [Sinanaerobacter sp. ZZT-01]WRR94330.1 ribosomal protein L7/L12 [Sinanaerobacter sp. ZZT-01]
MNYYYVFGFVCSIMGLMALEISSLKKVIRDLQERLNCLAKLTDHEELSLNWISSELKEQVIQLTRDGKKVEAIKKIRQQTQMGLLEAKQYVEKLD